MPLLFKIKGTMLMVTGSGVLTETDVENFCKSLINTLQGPPVKIFFDLRNVETAEMCALTTMASFMSNYEELARDKIIANSILVQGYTTNVLLNLLFKIKQPTTPVNISYDIQDACDFLNNF